MKYHAQEFLFDCLCLFFFSTYHNERSLISRVFLLLGNRYEKTCLQDWIDADLSLEKLAPSHDFHEGDTEASKTLVLNAKERVVARLTVMVQQLQREAVTMGPLVDSFSTPLLELVLAAVSEELHPPSSGSGDDSDGGSKHLQAISLSDSPALLETVHHIQSLELKERRRKCGAHKDQQGMPKQSRNSGSGRTGTGTDGVVSVAEKAGGLGESGRSIAAAPTHMPEGSAQKRGPEEVGEIASGLTTHMSDVVLEVMAKMHGPEVAAEVKRVHSAAAANLLQLQKKIAVYHSINPLSADELDWLIESKATNAYLVAERHEAEAQKAYGDTVNMQGSIHLLFDIKIHVHVKACILICSKEHLNI